MKLIVAIIKPFKLQDVKEALATAGIIGMTVTEVQSHDSQKGIVEVYRGSEFSVDFLPKVKIEIAVKDTLAAKTVDTIYRSAQTGKAGDGEIMVRRLGTVLRVRTGERGETAL